MTAGGTRDAFLQAAAVAVDLIGRRETGDRWDEPSILDGFSVRALAGHLGRAVLQVEWFLDLDEPDPPSITAARYYADLEGTADPSSELNQGVLQRAEETAAGGWARLYIDTMKVLERLEERLPEVPAGRRVTALGRSIEIDEYLKTRLVELCTHVEDLALSLDLPVPDLPLEATGTAIGVLVGAARLRHGDLAVLHALARRERDDIEALRVL